MSLDRCRLIELPKIVDARGNLSFIEGERHVPFAIKRVYYLYDVPGGETRAGHGHRTLQQFMIALSGSFNVILDDGRGTRTLQLNRPFTGLYICPGIWRELVNFSSGAVCLVLASEHYDAADYLRDYEEFRSFVGCGR